MGPPCWIHIVTAAASASGGSTMCRKTAPRILLLTCLCRNAVGGMLSYDLRHGPHRNEAANCLSWLVARQTEPKLSTTSEVNFNAVLTEHLDHFWDVRQTRGNLAIHCGEHLNRATSACREFSRATRFPAVASNASIGGDVAEQYTRRSRAATWCRQRGRDGAGDEEHGFAGPRVGASGASAILLVEGHGGACGRRAQPRATI